jgi:hypothetical protein
MIENSGNKHIMEHFKFFIVLFASLLLAMKEMSIALDEVEIESFILWTGVASVIAGLPVMLW